MSKTKQNKKNGRNYDQRASQLVYSLVCHHEDSFVNVLRSTS